MEVRQLKTKFELIDRHKRLWKVTLECGHNVEKYFDLVDSPPAFGSSVETDICYECGNILTNQLVNGSSLERELETLSKYFTLADESGHNPHEVIAKAREVQPEHAPKTAELIRRTRKHELQDAIDYEIKK